MTEPKALYAAVLASEYGIITHHIERLPLGNDSTASVYQVFAEHDTTYFLKVKRNVLPQASVLVPHHLYKQGLTQVVAPIPNKNQALFTPVNDVSLILYPYVSDHNAMDKGMSLAQWGEYGRIVKQIHSVPLPQPDIIQFLPRADFVPDSTWLHFTDFLQHISANVTYPHPTQNELADFLQGRQTEIGHIVHRWVELSSQMRQNKLPFVLCHGDIHTANLLVDKRGDLFVVDWDQTISAPKERDLMFVAAGDIEKAHEQAFFSGYGHVDINWAALTYYRYAWVVQEFVDYGKRIFTDDMGGIDEATRADAVRGFKQLFLAGDVIDVAYACEKHLI